MPAHPRSCRARSRPGGPEERGRGLSRPSLQEILAVIAEVEDLDRTRARFPGLSRDNLRDILLERESSRRFEPAPRPVQGARELRVWTDGASRGNPGPASIGVVIRGGRGELLAELARVIGKRTNNFAEYEAVRSGLAHALELGATKVVLHADSELVVRQLNGVYRVRHPDLKPLYDAVKSIEASFSDGVAYRHVPREQNQDADRLANLALDQA